MKCPNCGKDCTTHQVDNSHLINWRRVMGLSQDKLAVLLGTSQMTVSRWETGQFSPSPEYLEKLKGLGYVP